MALNFIPGTDIESVEWNALTLGTTYTVACKLNADTDGTYVLLSQGSGDLTPIEFRLLLIASANISFRVQDDAANDAFTTGGYNWATGTWISAIGIRSGNNVDCYSNAVGTALTTATQASSSPASYGTFTSTRFICGGQQQSDTKNGITNFEFDGKMAEIAVWDGVALTADERNAYHVGVPANRIRSSSLVFYSPLWPVATSSAHENIATSTDYAASFNGTPDASNHPPMMRYAPMPQDFSYLENKDLNACIKDFLIPV